MLFNTVVKHSITATTLFHAYSKGVQRHSVLGGAEGILCRVMKLKNPIAGQWQRVWKHTLAGLEKFEIASDTCGNNQSQWWKKDEAMANL